MNMKNETITISLNEFLKKAYGYDYMKEFEEGLEFYGLETLEATDDEVEEAMRVLGIEDEELAKEAVIRAKEDAYRTSFEDQYFTKVENELEDKIMSDFENLQTFFNDGDEVNSDDLETVNNSEVNVVSLDWSNNEITFEGNTDKLLAYVIYCINGNGMFYYENINEFKETCYGEDNQKNFESHMHWLSELEDIYGSIYNLFSFDTEYISRYCYGSEEYSEEQLKEAYECVSF